MLYDKKDYFVDISNNNITGVLIIDTDESIGYRITEQRDGEWCAPFWIPSSEFRSYDLRIQGTLITEQFTKVAAMSKV